MNQNFIIFRFFLLLLFGFQTMAQTIDQKKLYEEIQDLNREQGFEESIIKLETIIGDESSGSLDKYHAYLLKAQTYKRVFDYASTSKNLDLAYEEGMKTDRKKEVETKIAIERLFVDFDQQLYERIPEDLEKIDTNSLHLMDGTTLAFYYNVLAVLEFQKDNFQKAKETLEQGIKLLEKNEPQHLPAVYIKLLELSEHTNDEKLAVEAFRQGVFYSEKYKMEIYKVNLYRQLSRFYLKREDYKKAYNLFILGTDLIGSYNAPSLSGKLNSVEKEIMLSRKNLEIRNERNIVIFISVISIILCVLILVLFQLFRVNKRARKLSEIENHTIREELKKLSFEQTETQTARIDLNKHDLTERQLEIIRLIQAGKSNKEIASALFISENTVKYHLKIIYNLLGIDNRFSLKPATNEIVS